MQIHLQRGDSIVAQRTAGVDTAHLTAHFNLLKGSVLELGSSVAALADNLETTLVPAIDSNHSSAMIKTITSAVPSGSATVKIFLKRGGANYLLFVDTLTATTPVTHS